MLSINNKIENTLNKTGKIFFIFSIFNILILTNCGGPEGGNETPSESGSEAKKRLKELNKLSPEGRKGVQEEFSNMYRSDGTVNPKALAEAISKKPKKLEKQINKAKDKDKDNKDKDNKDKDNKDKDNKDKDNKDKDKDKDNKDKDNKDKDNKDKDNKDKDKDKDNQGQGQGGQGGQGQKETLISQLQVLLIKETDKNKKYKLLGDTEISISELENNINNYTGSEITSIIEELARLQEEKETPSDIIDKIIKVKDDINKIVSDKNNPTSGMNEILKYDDSVNMFISIILKRNESIFIKGEDKGISEGNQTVNWSQFFDITKNAKSKEITPDIILNKLESKNVLLKITNTGILQKVYKEYLEIERSLKEQQVKLKSIRVKIQNKKNEIVNILKHYNTGSKGGAIIQSAKIIGGKNNPFAWLKSNKIQLVSSLNAISMINVKNNLKFRDQSNANSNSSFVKITGASNFIDCFTAPETNNSGCKLKIGDVSFFNNSGVKTFDELQTKYNNFFGTLDKIKTELDNISSIIQANSNKELSDLKQEISLVSKRIEDRLNWKSEAVGEPELFARWRAKYEQSFTKGIYDKTGVNRFLKFIVEQSVRFRNIHNRPRTNDYNRVFSPQEIILEYCRKSTGTVLLKEAEKRQDPVFAKGWDDLNNAVQIPKEKIDKYVNKYIKYKNIGSDSKSEEWKDIKFGFTHSKSKIKFNFKNPKFPSSVRYEEIPNQGRKKIGGKYYRRGYRYEYRSNIDVINESSNNNKPCISLLPLLLRSENVKRYYVNLKLTYCTDFMHLKVGYYFVENAVHDSDNYIVIRDLPVEDLELQYYGYKVNLDDNILNNLESLSYKTYIQNLKNTLAELDKLDKFFEIFENLLGDMLV